MAKDSISEPTMYLRWRGNTLEQLWEVRSTGLRWLLTSNLHYEWRPVPSLGARFEHMDIEEGKEA